MAKIVLASTSPRRIDILTQAGFNPKVVAPDVDETILKRESPRSMVARLSRDKAEAVAAKILSGVVPGLGAASLAEGGIVIIAADTTVVAPDGKTNLGKPASEAEARRMLANLAGKVHTVLTGYCILKLEAPKAARKRATSRESELMAVTPFRSHVLVRVVKSSVRMRPLSRADIARYVRTGEPMDKAGSYAAQGIGMALIESINGSHANVVGLPICQVAADLEARFGAGFLGGPDKKSRRK